MSTDSQLATAPVAPGFHKATTLLSATLGIEPRMMVETLKKQCFPSMRAEDVSDAQLAAFISVANTLNLNPLVPGMMYGYPTKNGGIQPMMGPDGVYKKLSDHDDVVAQKDGGPAFWTEHGKDEAGKDTCTGYINHRTKGLLKKPIWVDEWVVSSNSNWQSRRHHMAETRALKQVARLVIHGLPMDSDEVAISEMSNVTPEAPPDRPPPPPRAKKGASAVAENKPTGKVVEGEFTEQPPKDPVTPPPAPDDKKATEVPQSEIDAAKAKASALRDEKDRLHDNVTDVLAKSKAQQEEKNKPRTKLNPDELVDVVCTVKSLTGIIASVPGVAGKTGTMGVELTGDFEGTAYHMGGGTITGDEVVAKEPWKVGARVKLTLFGKSYPATTKNPAMVRVLVDKVEAVASGAIEVDFN